ncbi:hypothetical protein EVJ24_15005 [Exiguobacterium sp. SH1S21]|uniref:hypothetical protein n=1 Tax=Exiguobacterium sp. SH1S21 TaxID=2510953 RepID=UPI00103A6103|nr:hypothetical protein [Exiguobacterium sp. SH1S21]TCI50314.1 hypothetical protein EVJ24_15005 [Exiguobacterium sp. SH1S21]
MSRKVPSQFDNVPNEKKQEAEVPTNDLLDLSQYQTKKEKEKVKPGKTRVTILVDDEVAKRLDRASKRYGKGFKSKITTDALTKALDFLEQKEAEERAKREREGR